MSQLAFNQTIQSNLVTDPETTQRMGLFKNSENHSKKRPLSAFPRPISGPKSANDDNASICTGASNAITRARKLGHLPNYLKKETKSSVESELFGKYKKFKTAKKHLVEQQSNLMKNLEHLRVLQEKLLRFGGRDFKIESLDLIEFTGGGSEIGCGDGDHIIVDVSKPFGHCSDGLLLQFEQEIQRIRGKVKDCLINLIELNSDALAQIQACGSEELKDKIQDIFSKVDEHVRSLNDEQDTSVQFLLDNLQQLRNPSVQEVQPMKISAHEIEEIAGLRRTVQNLEIHAKMLQSEIDVKAQEIEYLKNKETNNSKSEENSCDKDRNELESEISAQKELIKDYQSRLDEHLKLQEVFEDKIRELEAKAAQQNHEMEENLIKFKSDLSEEQKKYEELGKMLEDSRNVNSQIMQNSGSSFELVSNQLVAANEDVKELKFKISKREKQIQNLKQIINAESNKTKDFDQLLQNYEDLRDQDQHKSKEIQQLKEKVVVRTDTINSQIVTISELKKLLMAQGASGGGGIDHSTKDNKTAPLQDDRIAKFSEHERIIQKLENNKIRSNALRDQLLDRITMLEKENEDMKAQIRKFHEDFTINRFMYDEQRRKKRLTEILVKQYQN